MSNDHIEDAEWEDVPGNKGNLVARGPGKHRAFDQSSDFHAGYGAGYREGAKGASAPQEEPAAEADNAELREQIRAQLLAEQQQQKVLSFEAAAKRWIKRTLTAIGWIVVVVFFISLISGHQSTADPAEANKAALAKLIEQSPPAFSEAEEPEGICNFNNGAHWVFRSNGDKLDVLFTQDVAYSIQWMNADYDGRTLTLANGKRLKLATGATQRLNTTRRLTFERDTNGNWFIDGKQLFACTYTPDGEASGNTAVGSDAAAAAEAAGSAASAAAEAADEAASAAAQ